MGYFVRRASALASLSAIVILCVAPAGAYPGENKDIAAECAKPAGCVLDAKARIAVEPWADAAFAPVCDAHRVCYATRTKTKATCDGELDAKLTAACKSTGKDATTCARTTGRYREGIVREGARTHPAIQQCARNVTLANIASDCAGVAPAVEKAVTRAMADDIEAAEKSAAETKAKVEGDAAAVKASALRIFELAGMSYTPPPPSTSLAPQQAKLVGATCALKTGAAQQLCNLAEAARPLADRASTQVGAVLAPFLSFKSELDTDRATYVRRRVAAHSDPAMKLKSTIDQRQAQGPVDEATTVNFEQHWKVLYANLLGDDGSAAHDYGRTYREHLRQKAEPLTTAFVADRAKAADLLKQAEAVVAQSKRIGR